MIDKREHTHTDTWRIAHVMAACPQPLPYTSSTRAIWKRMYFISVLYDFL